MKIETQIIKFLTQNIIELQSIYLFGSVAANTAQQGSDIDIAFYSTQAITSLQRWDLQQSLAIVLNKDVDLVDLKTASEVMQAQIISKGHRLFVKDTNLVERYENKVFQLYIDLKELTQDIVSQAIRTGNIYE